MVGFSVKHRWVLVGVAALILVGGLAQLRHAKVDALPEFNPPQVEVQTEALGLSAQEVEQLLTVPLERNHLNGLPFLKTIHSESVPGLSSIQLTFEPGTNLFTARQLVQEALSTTNELPNVSKPPQMLQSVSSDSRVLMVGLSSTKLSPIDLTVLTQFTVRPRLLGVPGVAGVAIFGARDLQLQVQADPAQLAAKGVTLDQVIATAGNALFVSPLTFLEASTPGSGGFFDTSTQRLGIQHILPIKTPADLANVAVADSNPPIKLGDVATVIEDHQPLIGDASLPSGPGLLLVIQKLPQANTQEVTRGLDQALAQLKPSLKGVQIDGSVYRPQSYIDRAIHNLRGAALLGGLLGLVVLALLAWSWRAALVAALTGALSVLTAAGVLALGGQTFNAVVVAGLMAALALVIFDAVASSTPGSTPGSPHGRALVIGTVVVGVGLAPFLFLEGLPFKAFLAPATRSYALAVLASLLVALLVAPALASVLSGPGRPGAPRWSGPARREGRRGPYRALLGWVSRRAALAALVPTLAVLALGLVAVGQLHTNLLPTFAETDLLVHWDGPPGTALTETGRIMDRAQAEVLRLPGVASVGTTTGRAVTGDQVVGSGSGEMWIALKPSADRQATLARVTQVINGYPGFRTTLSSFLNDRVSQLQGRDPHALVVRVQGVDFDVLNAKAAEIQRAMATIRGVTHASAETQPLQPTIQVSVDLAAAEKAGIKPGDVRRGATTLVSGLTVGSLYQDQKVFQVVVVGPPGLRHDLTTIANVAVNTPLGGQVRLGDVASITIGPSVSTIEHNDTARSVDVTALVRGRSVASAAREITARLAGISFPSEYDARVLPVQQDSAAARQRLALAGLLGLLVVFLVFQATFSNWRLATLALGALPVAVAGALVATWADGPTFSLGSALGLLAAGGLAARSAILLISGWAARERNEPGRGALAILQASADGAAPTTRAALVLGVGLLPFLALGHVPGTEIVRPLAVSLLGGLAATILVALVVLPGGYLLGAGRRGAAVATPGENTAGEDTPGADHHETLGGALTGPAHHGAHDGTITPAPEPAPVGVLANGHGRPGGSPAPARHLLVAKRGWLVAVPIGILALVLRSGRHRNRTNGKPDA